MKIAVYFMVYLQVFAYFRDIENGLLNLSRTKRDLISWNRMANNAFALKKGLHSTENEHANLLVRIMKFCQKSAKNNSNKNGTIWCHLLVKTRELGTHLYMASQEILFGPMKRIQMDSDHQLKINVSDK